MALRCLVRACCVARCPMQSMDDQVGLVRKLPEQKLQDDGPEGTRENGHTGMGSLSQAARSWLCPPRHGGEDETPLVRRSVRR